jgi:hypothetical protein
VRCTSGARTRGTGSRGREGEELLQHESCTGDPLLLASVPRHDGGSILVVARQSPGGSGLSWGCLDARRERRDAFTRFLEQSRSGVTSVVPSRAPRWSMLATGANAFHAGCRHRMSIAARKRLGPRDARRRSRPDELPTEPLVKTFSRPADLWLCLVFLSHAAAPGAGVYRAVGRTW